MIGLTNFHKLFTKITQLHRSSSLILLPLFSEKKIGIQKKREPVSNFKDKKFWM